MTQFAISADFLTSLSYLPRQARRQVGSFVFKFRQDPRSSGINLERIQGARSPAVLGPDQRRLPRRGRQAGRIGHGLAALGR